MRVRIAQVSLDASRLTINSFDRSFLESIVRLEGFGSMDGIGSWADNSGHDRCLIGPLVSQENPSRLDLLARADLLDHIGQWRSFDPDGWFQP